MNYGARNTIGIAFLTTGLAFLLGSIMRSSWPPRWAVGRIS